MSIKIGLDEIYAEYVHLPASPIATKCNKHLFHYHNNKWEIEN